MRERRVPARSVSTEAAAGLAQVVRWPARITRDWAFGDSTGEGVRICILDSGIDAGHPLVGEVASAVAVALVEGEAVVTPDSDRFYIIREGHVAVLGKTLAPGDFFGEVALLRDVPRTATVTAVDAVSMYALERDDFIGAVAGSEPSVVAADAVIETRLGRPRREVAAG